MSDVWARIRKLYEFPSIGLTPWMKLSIYSCRLEFKWQDIWIGVFVRMDATTIQTWCCVIPMFPIHVIRALPQEAQS